MVPYIRFLWVAVMLVLAWGGSVTAQPGDCLIGYCLERNALGFTKLAPSADSRIVYVSSSQGDDATGVIYSVSSNSDPTNPLSAVRPFRTLAAARAQLRTGYPDYLLLRRGDTFDGPLVWNLFGRSASEPAVLAAYGSGPRPIIAVRLRHNVPVGNNYSGLTIAVPSAPQNWNLVVQGLQMSPHPLGSATGVRVLGRSSADPVSNLLLEDLVTNYFGSGIVIDGGSSSDQRAPDTIRNVSIRRCISVRNVDPQGTWSGVGAYLSAIDNLLLEDNLFAYGGWNPEIPAHDLIFPLNNDPVVWRSVGDGRLQISFSRSSGGTLSVSVQGLSFASAQSLADVAELLEAGINAAAGQRVVQASLLRWSQTDSDWLILRGVPPGSVAVTSILAGSGAGTDLSTTTYLGSTGGNLSPSIFRRNLYLQQSTLASVPARIHLRGNISARSASEGVQGRNGGLFEENAFIENTGNFFGRSSTVRYNLVYDSRDISPGSPRGTGIGLWNDSAVGEHSVATENILTRRSSPATYNLNAFAISSASAAPGRVTLSDNLVYRWSVSGASEAVAVVISGSFVPYLELHRNEFQMVDGVYLIRSSVPIDSSRWRFGDNHYATPNTRPFWFPAGSCSSGVLCSVAEWLTASQETDAQFGAIGYSAPNRTVDEFVTTVWARPYATVDTYLDLLAERDPGVWGPEFSAQALNDFFRCGFNRSPITGSCIPPVAGAVSTPTPRPTPTVAPTASAPTAVPPTALPTSTPLATPTPESTGTIEPSPQNPAQVQLVVMSTGPGSVFPAGTVSVRIGERRELSFRPYPGAMLVQLRQQGEVLCTGAGCANSRIVALLGNTVVEARFEFIASCRQLDSLGGPLSDRARFNLFLSLARRGDLRADITLDDRVTAEDYRLFLTRYQQCLRERGGTERQVSARALTTAVRARSNEGLEIRVSGQSGRGVFVLEQGVTPRGLRAVEIFVGARVRPIESLRGYYRVSQFSPELRISKARRVPKTQE